MRYDNISPRCGFVPSLGHCYKHIAALRLFATWVSEWFGRRFFCFGDVGRSGHKQADFNLLIQKMLALIVAVSDNGVIGKDNELPWRLPNDLKHFKVLTLGHPVLMGRRTYESIGRALPGRANIVVTRQADWAAPGVEVFNSVPAALARAQALDGKVCVIGGGEIYAQTLALADVVYLTEVHTVVENGTAFFPALPPTEWREESRERHEADERHAVAFSFVTLRSIKNEE